MYIFVQIKNLKSIFGGGRDRGEPISFYPFPIENDSEGFVGDSGVLGVEEEAPREQMYYYLLPQNQSKALGGAIAPIASSVERSDAPRALSESHRSRPQGNPPAVTYNLDKTGKNYFPDY